MTDPVEPTDPDSTESDPDQAPLAHPSPIRRGLWLVIGVLLATSLLLTSRNQLPAAPVLVVVMATLGFGLWWLADRGGTRKDRPVAGPVEALTLVGAVLASIVIFWVVFGWLQ